MLTLDSLHVLNFNTIALLLREQFLICRQVLWNTSIVGVKLHQGPVTELRLRKPRLSTGGFKVFPGKAGQYCFLNIPELSRFEWHPFSLTSGQSLSSDLGCSRPSGYFTYIIY